MSDQWYCSRNGKQVGPMSEAQLRQSAAVGKLQPTDLVWKQGMGEWTPAQKLKGLFPPAAPNPQLPPPLPAAALSRSSTSAAPALWTPDVACNWSLLLSWGFGAFLLAANWRA